MRLKWAFQLLPSIPGILSKGFRVDPVTQAVEDEVNAVLQKKFEFHGISKLVIRLGPNDYEKRDYHEHIGVAQKRYPNFDVVNYNALSAEDKVIYMRRLIYEVFDWLIASFPDAQCFSRAKQDLGWAVD